MIIEQQLYFVDPGNDVGAGVLVWVHRERQIGPIPLHFVYALLQGALLRGSLGDALKLRDEGVETHRQDLAQGQIGIDFDRDVDDRRDLGPVPLLHPGIAQRHHHRHLLLELLDPLAHRARQIARVRLLQRFLQLVEYSVCEK